MKKAVRPQDTEGDRSFEHPHSGERRGGGGLPGRDPVERFQEKYRENKRTKCWEWQGALNSRGYGCFAWGGKGKSILAHRWAWLFLAEKTIPDGRVLSHTCENHTCVNPEHMFLNDPEKAKRTGVGPVARNAQATHCSHGHPLSGENLRMRADGRRICATCQAKHEHERSQRQRVRRLKAGLCPYCGKRKPSEGFASCNSCREQNREYMRKYNKEQRP
jgi:hypothetical protein